MFSSSQNLPLPTIAPAEKALTLRDLFTGQPIDEYSEGAAIFWEGDPAGQIFDIAGGVVRVYRVLADGRRAIVSFIYPGDVIGVSLRPRYIFTAQAVTDVKVRRFPRRRFFSLIDESPALRPQLVALLCNEMSAAQRQMLLLHRSAEERVVSFLLAVQRKSDAGNSIQLPMGRLDIADYVGLTIETVSRIMTSLTRRGLIVAAGRQFLTLRKPNSLREIAGSDEWEDAGSESPSARRAVWPD